MATPKFTPRRVVMVWADLYASGLNALEIAVQAGVHPSTVYYQLKKHGVSRRLNGGNVSENHYRWKGDSVGYYALHNWIRKQKGKARKCEECGKEGRCHWANISGEYKRDINDFKSLCASCHRQYDYPNFGKARSRYATE